MKLSYLLAAAWNALLVFELSNNPVHQAHAEADTTCDFWWFTCASLALTILWMLYDRKQRFAALDADATPAPAQPLRRDLPRPTPPPITITPVPAERYVFLATNDPNIDLQPKGRDHRG